MCAESLRTNTGLHTTSHYRWPTQPFIELLLIKHRVVFQLAITEMSELVHEFSNRHFQEGKKKTHISYEVKDE